MAKKESNRRLSLKRETLRRLQGDELAAVAGGTFGGGLYYSKNNPYTGAIFPNSVGTSISRQCDTWDCV